MRVRISLVINPKSQHYFLLGMKGAVSEWPSHFVLTKEAQSFQGRDKNKRIQRKQSDTSL